MGGVSLDPASLVAEPASQAKPFSGPPASSISSVAVAGTGSAIPATVVINEDIAALVGRYQPDKGAAWAEEKLGIRERRFLTELDPATGHPIGESDELALAELAARQAIGSAGLEPSQIDGIWYVSCTQPLHRQHFSASVLELHRRLRLRANAITLEMDAGCGGALHAMSHARQILAAGACKTFLVVASNAPSQFYGNWEAYLPSGAWLSMYVFGDGAGAVLLQATANRNAGIIASYTAVDPSRPLMEMRSVNGGERVYYIDGRGVAASFGIYARRALDELKARHPFSIDEISRFYFHQVNGKVLSRFTAEVGIPERKVATHVERYGNIAAAATLVLLDEDRRAGVVRDGDLCVLCTVGAGAQYGAMLVRL